MTHKVVRAAEGEDIEWAFADLNMTKLTRINTPSGSVTEYVRVSLKPSIELVLNPRTFYGEYRLCHTWNYVQKYRTNAQTGTVSIPVNSTTYTYTQYEARHRAARDLKK